MFTLIIIGTVFVLSLLGAVILFKFLKSTALVTVKKYQAGGAIAGFIIIYGTLMASFYGIENLKNKEVIEEYERLKEMSSPKHITGRVVPYTQHTKIILAVKETDPDNLGTFRMKASCLDPENEDVSLYVIVGDKHVHYNIYSTEEMSGIDIPVEF